jgi:hypothetical protein
MHMPDAWYARIGQKECNMKFVSEETSSRSTKWETYKTAKSVWLVDGRYYTVSAIESRKMVTSSGRPEINGETSVFSHPRNRPISLENEIFRIAVFTDSLGQQGGLVKEAMSQEEVDSE